MVTDEMRVTAEPARQSSRIAPAKREQILVALCSGQFVPLDLLAEAVNRNAEGLRKPILQLRSQHQPYMDWHREHVFRK